MAILKIAKMGHPVLMEPAKTVDDPSSREIARLISDMKDTLADSCGIGLAATQVHIPLKLMIFKVPAARGGEVQPLTTLINPSFTIDSDEMEEDWEACLSVPELTGRVPRYTSIRYTGVTETGEIISRHATGFHARVFQHEFDHLIGYVYPQRMTDMKSLIFASEKRYYPAQ